MEFELLSRLWEREGDGGGVVPSPLDPLGFAVFSSPWAESPQLSSSWKDTLRCGAAIFDKHSSNHRRCNLFDKLQPVRFTSCPILSQLGTYRKVCKVAMVSYYGTS